MSYQALKGLKIEHYQHPGEDVAMDTMRKIPLLDVVFKQFKDVQDQILKNAETAGNNFRITEKTNPRIYNLYKLAMSRLDIQEEYPLYVELNYDFQAYAYGAKYHYIVLSSSIVSTLTDEELLFVIGHELGHIKSEHVVYQGLADTINSLVAGMGTVAAAVSVGVHYSLLEWIRNAEYTCDRAGMIAAGSPEAAYKFIIRLLGKSGENPYINFDVNEVLKQAADFKDASSDLIGKILYVTYTANQNHPWSILRLKQLKDWYDSGEYDRLVAQFSCN